MALASRQPMYENGVLRQAAGETLRPGGLDLTRRILELCDLPAEAYILDVGCGSGATVSYLREAGFVHAAGIDPSVSLLQTSTTLLALACARGSLLPVASSQVDAILAECSLSAMGDLDGSLAEFQRVLRPGGQLALSDVYARSPAGIPALHSLPLSCGLSSTTTQDELAGHLLANGFEILAWEDHSEKLKSLAARIISTHGSLSEFWSRSEPEAGPLDIQIALSKAKLGYFLVIARKVNHG